VCATLVLAPAPTLAAGAPRAAVEGCEEADFIVDAPGTVGQPLSLTESVDCLPAGKTWSGATIYWGDGTASGGTITHVSPADPESGPATVTVAGQHTYDQPGSFGITITVTDEAGDGYKGGWHTVAVIKLSQSPAQEQQPGGTPAPAATDGGTASPVCRVPALKGDSLAKARRVLAAAHCRLGTVHRPAHQHSSLYVSTQGSPAGRHLAAGARVALTLRAKRSAAKRTSHR